MALSRGGSRHPPCGTGSQSLSTVFSMSQMEKRRLRKADLCEVTLVKD